MIKEIQNDGLLRQNQNAVIEQSPPTNQHGILRAETQGTITKYFAFEKASLLTMITP